MRPFMTVLVVFMLAVPVFATDYAITSGYYGTKTYSNNDTLLMTGGGVDTLTGLNNSTLDIRSTSSYIPHSGGIFDLVIGDSSKLYFSGGHINLLDIGGSAIAELSGGQVNEIIGYYFFPANPSHIRVYCQSGWTYQNGYLSGLWQDATAFNIKIVTVSGYSDLFSNMTIVPEPATMLLLGSGVLFLRQRRK